MSLHGLGGMTTGGSVNGNTGFFGPDAIGFPRYRPQPHAASVQPGDSPARRRASARPYQHPSICRATPEQRQSIASPCSPSRGGAEGWPEGSGERPLRWAGPVRPQRSRATDPAHTTAGRPQRNDGPGRRAGGVCLPKIRRPRRRPRCRRSGPCVFRQTHTGPPAGRGREKPTPRPGTASAALRRSAPGGTEQRRP